MKKQASLIKIRIPKLLHNQMLQDLRRPHLHAAERIGFLYTTSKICSDGNILIVAKEYEPIPDGNYIRDKSVGARIDSSSIRHVMQRIFDSNEGCFHVHLHDHFGAPGPSWTDKKSLPAVVESFSNSSAKQANGFLILSKDSFYASLKSMQVSSFASADLVSIIGYPMSFTHTYRKLNAKRETFERQSFLGNQSQINFENVRIGIVGYGGGGSHIGQQLAHLGFQNVLVFDDDYIEITNLNRLVGATFKDTKKRTSKVDIASRVAKAILPNTKLQTKGKWQNYPEDLQQCDIVVGCVDTFLGRQELEAECRRYSIPYIDIGMDVFDVNGQGHQMSGQVILSMPGRPCMQCLGFLTEEKLMLEAKKYGDVGGRPQVVWPNAILASTAVGIVVDLITGWSKQSDKTVYLSYDGNNYSLQEHIRLNYISSSCTHYPLSQVGLPAYIKI